MTTIGIPSDFTFTFTANDGWTYPVKVEFSRRLPCVTLVGNVSRIPFGQLYRVLPRCRVVVTVDDSDIIRDYSNTALWADRSKALWQSGPALSDQLYIALQMAA